MNWSMVTHDDVLPCNAADTGKRLETCRALHDLAANGGYLTDVVGQGARIGLRGERDHYLLESLEQGGCSLSEVTEMVRAV